MPVTIFAVCSDEISEHYLFIFLLLARTPLWFLPRCVPSLGFWMSRSLWHRAYYLSSILSNDDTPLMQAKMMQSLRVLVVFRAMCVYEPLLTSSLSNYPWHRLEDQHSLLLPFQIGRNHRLPTGRCFGRLSSRASTYRIWTWAVEYTIRCSPPS